MDVSIETLLQLMQDSEIEVKGEFLWGSNYTFLVQMTWNEKSLPGVYKPSRGERPLWDFPSSSLAHREVAAFLVSEELGWEFVPPTVFLTDGPFGAGSLQLYIEHDPEYHYFTFEQKDRQRLRSAALFDHLINNADRKGSHVLVDNDNKLWLIDHGVCFHTQEKLRTVIWDFVGEPIPSDLISDLVSFLARLVSDNGIASPLFMQLNAHLGEAEIYALKNRAESLIKEGCYPPPDPERRHFPWPQI